MKTLLVLQFFLISFFAKAGIPTHETTSKKNTWIEKIKSFTPDTVSYDLYNENTVVFLKDRPALSTTNLGSPTNRDNPLLRLTNSISVTKNPSKLNSGDFGLNWVPVFTVAFHNLKFNSTMTFLDETDFQIFRTSLGIGPELSYQYGSSRYSINLSPGIAYSWVSYSSPVSGGSTGGTNLNLALSLIYSYSFFKGIGIRFYVRGILEDIGVWKESLSSSQGFDIPVSRVISTMTGLSFLWTF